MSFQAPFNENGIELNVEASNFSYLYGLSDFWELMFEDRERVGTLLGATTLSSSEVYSRFLQLTSSISLEDIQETLGCQLRLVLLSADDAVPGKQNTYRLPETILDAKVIANRPFLPTSVFEHETDFYINSTGSTIQFSQDPWMSGFPIRVTPEGTKQVALWFVDAKIDEQLIYKYYGHLIGVNSSQSTEAYKNFITGLYYVYIHGPNLSLVRKGLNLVIGLPLARENEIVLDIRKYLESDLWIVITDSNQYIIPYGLEPTVKIGDSLSTSDELASWIEVKDYESDGKWWLNLQLPAKLLPTKPAELTNRYIYEGGYLDSLMLNYLKNHTFLVRVNVTTFKDIQFFTDIFSVVKRVKPIYTAPIYIWSVPLAPETLSLYEKSFYLRKDSTRCEEVFIDIRRMRRDTTSPLTRKCPVFLRCQVSRTVYEQIGLDPTFNGPTVPLSGGYVNGFGAMRKAIGADTPELDAWWRMIFDRGNDSVRIGRSRAIHLQKPIADLNTGMPEYPPTRGMYTPLHRRVPLYITREQDIKDKFAAVGALYVEGKFAQSLFKPSTSLGVINDVAVNSQVSTLSGAYLQRFFSTLFYKDPQYKYLNPFIPTVGYTFFTEVNPADIQSSDYLEVVRISDDVCGVYWITTNNKDSYPGVVPIDDSEPLLIRWNRTINRGLAANEACPYYWTRESRDVLNQGSDAVNETAINTSDDFNSVLNVAYYDDNNVRVNKTRTGLNLIHKRILK